MIIAALIVSAVAVLLWICSLGSYITGRRERWSVPRDTAWNRAQALLIIGLVIALAAAVLWVLWAVIR